jgi:prepilin-type N-terminal cleavage/methylation domain-containing protein
MTAREKTRGFTIPELLISMSIMGIVLALAIVEFAMVFNHNNLMTANMSADQNARIAMAKVTNELRQAMPDVSDTSPPYTMVIQPTQPPPSTAPTAASVVEFYRVHNGAGGLVTPIPTDLTGNPKPCYDDVTLTYDSAARTITRTITPAVVSAVCNGATSTAIIARNVTNFGVKAESAVLFEVDLETTPSNGGYGVYDLDTQVALGYKP